VKLSRFQFKLYPIDPSSSEVIEALSNMGSAIVYIVAVLAALISLIVAFLGFLTFDVTILLIMAMWAPLVAFFGISQYALSKIISEAKRKKLNEIQARIEKLEAADNIEDKEVMGAVERLIAYHDQIKGTPNSALNLRAVLNFINSLLLPVVTFLLANLDKVLGLF